MLLDLHRHLEGSHSPRALLDVALAFDIRNQRNEPLMSMNLTNLVEVRDPSAPIPEAAE